MGVLRDQKGLCVKPFFGAVPANFESSRNGLPHIHEDDDGPAHEAEASDDKAERNGDHQGTGGNERRCYCQEDGKEGLSIEFSVSALSFRRWLRSLRGAVFNPPTRCVA
jgi:hypothetical protein